jgi:hypothetical protein
MKKFINPYNQKFDNHKSESKHDQNTKLASKASAIFKDKTFATEYKNIYRASNIVKLGANLISFFTCFFAALYVLKLLVGYYVACLVSSVVCLALEFIKNSLWLSTVKNKLRYNKITFGVLALFFITLLSFGASCFGAYVMLEELAPVPKLATYNQQDSTSISELKAINKQIESNQQAQYNISSGKNLTSGTNKRALKKLIEQASNLQAKKDSVSLIVATINKRIENESTMLATEHKTKNESLKIYLVSMSALSELLYLVCSIFVLFYLFRVYVDTTSNKSFKPFKTEINKQIEQPEQPHQRQPIGFNTKVVIDDNIKYILHNNKKYTSTQIKGNINANKSKLKKYQALNDKAKIERYAIKL